MIESYGIIKIGYQACATTGRDVEGAAIAPSTGVEGAHCSGNAASEVESSVDNSGGMTSKERLVCF